MIVARESQAAQGVAAQLTMASRAVRRSWWSYRNSLSRKSMACTQRERKQKKKKEGLQTCSTFILWPFQVQGGTSSQHAEENLMGIQNRQSRRAHGNGENCALAADPALERYSPMLTSAHVLHLAAMPCCAAMQDCTINLGIHHLQAPIPLPRCNTVCRVHML